MDLVLIELILWVGLLFFFWALKEGLSNVESDIESLGLANNKRLAKQQDAQFCRPERLVELIGRYRDKPIYRYAVINGCTYQFDRVCPQSKGLVLDADERYVDPGLVYQECTSQDQLPGTA
jgi:hypothetical protein